MRGSSVKYLIKEGLRNVWTNKLMSLASVGVLTACLLMVGFAVFLTSNLNAMVGYIGEQSTLMVFIKDGSTDEQIKEVEKTLKSNSKVKSARFISKEEALESYSKRISNNSAVDTLKETNVLPASFEVSLYQLDAIDSVSNSVKGLPAFESLTAPNNIAETINSLNKTIGWFGVIIFVALILVSIVIISNTIRATVFARHREIAIMKQVGATNNFVRLPFFIEGIAIGIFSAIIAFFMIWGGYVTVVGVLTKNTSSFLQSMFTSLVPFWDIGIWLSVVFLLGGMLAGALGSVISLRKHLKV